MGLKMRIKSGPSQGREHPIRPGFVVGRADVEISINDHKISGRHARVDMDAEGNLILVDLGSTNGLRVADKKLAKVMLTPGLSILIGKTEVEILKDAAGPAKEAPPPLPFDSDDEATRAPFAAEVTKAPEQKEVALEKPEWADFFSSFLKSSLENIKNPSRPLSAFDPLITMTVFRGVQNGTVWELGYGPRSFGLGGFEFPLFEKSAPPKAFTITPKGLSAYFSTEHSGIVLLNGRSVSSEKLNAGDIISIGETYIRIGFKE